MEQPPVKQEPTPAVTPVRAISLARTNELGINNKVTATKSFTPTRRYCPRHTQTNIQDPPVPTTAVILTTQDTALSTCTYDVGITLGNNLLKTESRISMTENFRTTNYEKLQQTGQVFLARNPGTISPKLKRPWQLQD